ncbi:hypothetical protein [Undibacterium sp. Ren11W]|uniref:hypothetical protein n=1 Tax=Undibacterium sp. Ren11W TaxID=3413045 RepID=UPI003BF2B836
MLNISKYLSLASQQVPQVKSSADKESTKTLTPAVSSTNVSVSLSPLKAKNTVAAASFSNGAMQFTSHKDAARQKIAWIKMQLEGLMRFAGVAGNPREAIRLAKELAAAVREYGGSDSAPAAPQATLNIAPQTENTSEAGVADAPANTADATTSASTASEASTAASLAAQVTANAQVASDSSIPSSKETAQNSTLDSIQDSEQNSAAAQIKQAAALVSEAKNFTQTEQNNDETVSSKASNSLAALAQVNTAGLSPQDRAFLAEAKILMGKIKLLIAIESKKAEDDKKAQAATKEMDDAFKTTTMSLMQENTSMAYAANGLSVTDSSSTPSLSETA